MCVKLRLLTRDQINNYQHFSFYCSLFTQQANKLVYELPVNEDVLPWEVGDCGPELLNLGLPVLGGTAGASLGVLRLPLLIDMLSLSLNNTSGGGGGSSTSASSWTSEVGGGGGISSMEVERSREGGGRSEPLNTSWSDVLGAGWGIPDWSETIEGVCGNTSWSEALDEVRRNTLFSELTDEVRGVADFGGTGGGGGEALPRVFEEWDTPMLLLGSWVTPRFAKGGDGGGGGGDTLRVLLGCLNELLPRGLSSPPFCACSLSSLLSPCGCAGSPSIFLENDFRGKGGGSNTKLCSGTTASPASVSWVSSFTSCSSSRGCRLTLSMVKGFGSKVFGVAAPALCVEGGSGEMGSEIFCSNKNTKLALKSVRKIAAGGLWARDLSLHSSDTKHTSRKTRINFTLESYSFPFFQASENKFPIFFEGFLGSILLLLTEKLMLPVRSE